MGSGQLGELLGQLFMSMVYMQRKTVFMVVAFCEWEGPGHRQAALKANFCLLASLQGQGTNLVKAGRQWPENSADG